MSEAHIAVHSSGPAIGSRLVSSPPPDGPSGQAVMRCRSVTHPVCLPTLRHAGGRRGWLSLAIAEPCAQLNPQSISEQYNDVVS